MVRNWTNEINLDGEPWMFFLVLKLAHSLALLKRVQAEQLHAPPELLPGGVVYADYWGPIVLEMKGCPFLPEG